MEEVEGYLEGLGLDGVGVVFGCVEVVPYLGVGLVGLGVWDYGDELGAGEGDVVAGWGPAGAGGVFGGLGGLLGVVLVLGVGGGVGGYEDGVADSGDVEDGVEWGVGEVLGAVGDAPGAWFFVVDPGEGCCSVGVPVVEGVVEEGGGGGCVVVGSGGVGGAVVVGGDGLCGGVGGGEGDVVAVPGDFGVLWV